MANDKKPEKNGSRKHAVKCDRTYVADRCSSAGASTSDSSSASASASAPPSPPSPPPPPPSPGPRGRKKVAPRQVSLTKPRPMDQRSGNAYAETTFPTARGQQQHRQQQQQRRQQQQRQQQQRQPHGLPLIDFSIVGEEIMMKPLRPANDDGLDEFPAYVPWKAAAFPAGAEGAVVTRRAPVGGNAAAAGPGPVALCEICKRCRCRACRGKCAAAAAHDGQAAGRPSAVAKWVRLMVRVLCPCLPAVRRGPRQTAAAAVTDGCPAADKCHGNAAVAGCECVDWDALERERRRRRHHCQRRHLLRVSDTTISTNSTAVNDSSSGHTVATAAQADAREEFAEFALMTAAYSYDGIKSTLGLNRNHKQDSD